MSTPAIIYLCLTAAALALTINDHGKPRSPQNAWHSITAVSITISLLYLGGFFS